MGGELTIGFYTSAAGVQSLLLENSENLICRL